MMKNNDVLAKAGTCIYKVHGTIYIIHATDDRQKRKWKRCMIANAVNLQVTKKNKN